MFSVRQPTARSRPTEKEDWTEMAWITKRQTTKGVVYDLRYRDQGNRVRSETFARRADAERRSKLVAADLVRGEWSDPRLAQVRFNSYSSDWLRTKRNVAPRTLINIEGRLRNHVLPTFATASIGSIRPVDVRSWVADMVEGGMAPTTVKATYLTFSQVMGQAEIDGLIPRTPCIGVTLPRLRQGEEMHFLDADQVADLVDAIGPRFRNVIYTAAYAGLRAGELAALRPERVSVKEATIDVVESLTEVRGRILIGPTKTGKRRTIEVPRFLADMIGLQMTEYPSSCDQIFTATEGGPLRHRNFSARHFKPAVRRAEVPDGLRYHDLRHTCAALLIAEGRSMHEVKDYLGHSTIRVTSDRYGHLFPQARKAAAEALNNAFEESAQRRSARYSRDGTTG